MDRCEAIQRSILRLIESESEKYLNQAMKYRYYPGSIPGSHRTKIVLDLGAEGHEIEYTVTVNLEVVLRGKFKPV